jgi:hypothetical protein
MDASRITPRRDYGWLSEQQRYYRSCCGATLAGLGLLIAAVGLTAIILRQREIQWVDWPQSVEYGALGAGLFLAIWGGCCHCHWQPDRLRQRNASRAAPAGPIPPRSPFAAPAQGGGVSDFDVDAEPAAAQPHLASHEAWVAYIRRASDSVPSADRRGWVDRQVQQMMNEGFIPSESDWAQFHQLLGAAGQPVIDLTPRAAEFSLEGALAKVAQLAPAAARIAEIRTTAESIQDLGLRLRFIEQALGQCAPYSMDGCSEELLAVGRLAFAAAVRSVGRGQIEARLNALLQTIERVGPGDDRYNTCLMLARAGACLERYSQALSDEQRLQDAKRELSLVARRLSYFLFQQGAEWALEVPEAITQIVLQLKNIPDLTNPILRRLDLLVQCIADSPAGEQFLDTGSCLAAILQDGGSQQSNAWNSEPVRQFMADYRHSIELLVEGIWDRDAIRQRCPSLVQST